MEYFYKIVPLCLIHRLKMINKVLPDRSLTFPVSTRDNSEQYFTKVYDDEHNCWYGLRNSV